MNKPKVSIFLLSYIIIVSAGIFFCTAPLSFFDEVEVYTSLKMGWGFFYIIGGLVAAIATVSGWFRPLRKREIMLSYFEMAGLFLIISANLIYSYVLIYSGIDSNEQNLVAAALVILGTTAIYPFRISKMREQISINMQVKANGE